MQALGSSQDRARDDALDIFIIAGEESGDRLGAPLMAAIAAQADRPVAFAGVGGHAMAAQGLTSLVPIADLAINGFAAIPGRLPAILRHLRLTTRAVIAARPDALVIIDSPDFTHRVARRVRAAAPSIPIIDYVSPTVWASRPAQRGDGRHRYMAGRRGGDARPARTAAPRARDRHSAASRRPVPVAMPIRSGTHSR